MAAAVTAEQTAQAATTQNTQAAETAKQEATAEKLVGESAEPARAEETHIDSTNIDTSWLVFSQRDTSPEANTIREQLRMHQEEINAMNAVADKVVSVPDMRSKTAIVNWVMEQLADYGYEVERDDIGTISFEKKRIKTGIGYIHSRDTGRLAAFAALPEVLQEGIIIDRHSNHKGRSYETYTIAAPVVINDIRGNMAVTVIKTNGNHYRAHRILLPDGSGFVFANKNDAASGTSGGVTDNGSLAQSTATASENSIRQTDQNVNPETQYQARDEVFSMREPVEERRGLVNEREDLQFQKREYTYDELTAKPDMSVTRIDTTQNIDRNEAVRLGRENVMQYADRFDANGTPAMYVDDLGKYVVVGNNALKHGLDGQRVSAQAPVIAKIGDILSNSIVVNEATPKKNGVRNSWIMLGAAQDGNDRRIYVRSVINQSTGHLDDVSALYAAYAKKEEAGRTFSVPGASANGLGNRTNFTISIADLLNGVKDHFSDVLSEDVAQHLGIERAESEFTANLKYQPRDEQISTREMLANMMDTAANSADEKAWLKGYRAQLREMDHWLDAISQNKKTVRELMFKKGRTAEETTQLNKARERLKILQDKVSRVDEGLLKLENADVIRGLVRREAQRIRNEETEKRRAGIAKVRETQRNTAVRKNIMRRAKKIDQMLRTPTDREHIPEGLKGAMLDLMDALTKNDEGAFGGSAKDMERLRRAQAEYEAMRSSDPDSYIAGQYDEDITAEKFTEKMGDMNDKFRNF